MKVGVLASGGLGAKCLELIKSIFTPIFIATDSNSTDVIDFATKNNISLFKGNPRNGSLSNFLGDQHFDIIFSINYLFIIEKEIIEKTTYPINFHGSLLPKYRGRTPHVWSIINNEKKTGVTAHIIDDGCDSGPIVLQKEIEITEQDTGASILLKYENIYPEMILEVLGSVKNKTLNLQSQDHDKATYYSKRTPSDGAIDWHWQKERIRNWVRAQSYPYPGAFALLGDEKIIIDEIAFSDMGYKDTDPDGLILSEDPFIVKTPNGAIELIRIRNQTNNLSKENIFQ
ncbi:MAG: methionyl-tRNA formyltransferase [Bacteroidota bacterium]